MTDPRGAAEEAIALYRSGCYREALARFETLIDLGAEPGESCYWSGLASRALGRHAEAADHLYLAAHYLPRDERVWVALAEALVETGRAEEAIDALRRAAEVAQSPAAALRAMASVLKALGRIEQCTDALRRVVAERPEDAVDRSLLALALLRGSQIEAAWVEAGHALRLDPGCVQACHHAGLVARERGQIALAAELFRRALAAIPGSLEVRSALAHALRDLGRFDEALAEYQAVLERDPAYQEALLNRAHLLLMCGRFAEGWDAYECRYAFPGAPRPTGTAPLWEARAREPVLVVGEQGLGDQVMFASCILDLLAVAGRVTIDCHPRLVSLFQRSYPGAEVRAQAIAAKPDGAAGSAIAMGSLPRHFRRSREAFPVDDGSLRGYLRADPQRAASWSARLQDGAARLTVGIAWRGGSVQTRGHLRSIPPSLFASLAGVAGVRWVSLQYGDTVADLEALRAGGMHAARFAEIESAIEDCAAAILATDLVVTIDNTVAHLAGALGKPVWILLNAGAEWRYGFASSSLAWYPRARLFRGREGEDWSEVLRQVGRELERLDPPAR